ncbi:hypothetical protein QT969_25225 [Rhodococcus sp. CSLK01-03]|uniref:Ferric iron reductase FhuF-like transporter n=1 Tax=Rhodococcus indonesiensis TaxID=3055869 RepID=A0ABT7RVB0_9NOCA|nr:hypothetical protein [Rhodococcus indonesiensis]MDM7491584.1 hypothetical protein [Rhodococcus indonesiensis]
MTTLLPPRSTPVQVPAFEDTDARLRLLVPHAPRVYAVARIDDEPRRRWWRLADPDRDRRIALLYARALEDVADPRIAADQVAAALAHVVAGRVLAPYLLEARCWDPGLDNLWIHQDSDGGIDWAAVADDTLRVLPDDPAADEPVVVLPCEEALARWTAHRATTALHAAYASLARCAPTEQLRLWSLLGRTVVAGAAQIPLLAGTSRAVAARRGQLLLDAFLALGVPVRGLCKLGKASL